MSNYTETVKACIIAGAGGDPGSNGPQGPTGSTGSTGSTGPRGDTGPSSIVNILPGRYGRAVVRDSSGGEIKYSSLLDISSGTYGDASDAQYNISGDTILVSANIIPTADVTYSLGSSEHRFSHGFFGPNSVIIGNTNYSSDIQGNAVVATSSGKNNAIPGSQTSENVLVAVGSTGQGTSIKYCYNTSTWFDVDISEGYDFESGYGVAWNSPNWVAVGFRARNSAGTTNFPILLSNCGTIWKLPTLKNTDQDIIDVLTTASGTAICFNSYDNRWYFANANQSGQSKYKILRSKDTIGNDWESAVDPSSNMFSSYFVDGLTSDGGIQRGILVASSIQDPTSALMWSSAESGFTTWNFCYTTTGDPILGAFKIAFSGTTWIVAALAGGAYRSSDGKTWVLVLSPEDPNNANFTALDVAYNGQAWMVVGYGTDNIIYISYDDGFSWKYMPLHGPVVSGLQAASA